MTFENTKFPTAHWSQYSPGIISALNLKKTTTGEYHGACPNCDGEDRFWIKEHQGEVRVHCRKCEDFKAITANLRRDGLLPSPERGPSERQSASTDPFPETSGPFTPESDPDPFPEAPYIDPQVPYHERKGVQLHGAALDGGNVVVPILNAEGKKVGTQTIKPNGDKRFNKGLEKEGAFGVIDGPLEGQCYIAEGWATAASVSEATGRPTVFALDAGNLPKVAAKLAVIRPGAEFVVAADNDEAGTKAAKEAGLPWVAPEGQGDDWNDVWVRQGKDAVAHGLDRRAEAKAGPNVISSLKIDSMAEFLSDLRPLEYLIDGLLPKGVTYSLTGHSGHGKTTLAIQIGLSVAIGDEFSGRKTMEGDVLFLAGENPYNVKWQVAAAIAARSLGPNDVNNVHFIQGRFSIQQWAGQFKEKIASIPNLKLVIIDSLQAFFEGENDNDNMQMVAMAHALRDLCDVDAQPAVLIIAHPAGKIPNKDNLVPRGGGAFLNEIDGNLTVWSPDEKGQRLHHTAKFRGAGFEPIDWVMDELTFPHLTDINGTPVKLKVSRPMSDSDQVKSVNDENMVLIAVVRNAASGWTETVRQMAINLSTTRHQVEKAIKLASEEKLIKRHAKIWRATTGGDDFLSREDG